MIIKSEYQPLLYSEIGHKSKLNKALNIARLVLYVCNGWNGQLPLVRLILLSPFVVKVLRNEEIDLLLVKVGGRRNYKGVQVVIELKCLFQSMFIVQIKLMLVGYSKYPLTLLIFD